MKKEYTPKLEIENELKAKGFSAVCGVDEAGRGPLAGPVVVAAVLMPVDENSIIEGIDDSKKLSEKRREELYKKIIKTAVEFKIAIADNFIIDEINILEATKLAMQDVLERMEKADVAIIDAVKIQSKIPVCPVVKGDALSYNVAAASIVAKVTRDRMMKEFATLYPGYGFEKHKGYGTKQHIAAIEEMGLCPIHRLTFAAKFDKKAQKPIAEEVQ